MHAYVHLHMQEYYWRIKYWQFHPKITNRQNLLLTNISSYSVTPDLKINYLKTTYVMSNVSQCSGSIM